MRSMCPRCGKSVEMEPLSAEVVLAVGFCACGTQIEWKKYPVSLERYLESEAGEKQG